MKKEKKDKHFLHLPKYPGGKKAFGDFLRTNLIYPEEALKNNIEGKVYVSFQVNDLGVVVHAEVVHSLGYGCDEEALRLVKMMKYEKVKNRGVRLISTVKTFIEFKLPGARPLQYNYVQKAPQTENSPIPKKEGVTYGYTIKIHRDS